MRGTKSSNETGCNIIPQLIKAGLIASVLSIALIVLFAVAPQQSWLDDGSIAVVTSVIKVLGAALASFVITKKCKNRAWVYGALAGIVYALMAFAIFSALSGTFSITLALLCDMAIGALAGMLTAMIIKALRG